MRIRTTGYVNVDGVEYAPGEVLELPEQKALGMVGEGQAEEIPEGDPDE